MPIQRFSEHKAPLNKNLSKARRNKKDEFYTQLSDIERELGHYKDYFKDKIVFCNCDDPEESNFWNYFALNFEFLGLKKLVSTHYETDKPSYKLEIVSDINDDDKINKLDTIKTKLKQNGDFRSPECIDILKKCDIIVTNPPFSLFREYVAQLMKYNKKFIIIGNQNAITYKEIFKLIKNNRLWLGTKSNIVMKFEVPDNYISENGYVRVPAISLFTNLEIEKRYENLILYKTYYGNEKDYPKYDNYDAININKIKDIPMDYSGVIGVPITFVNKHNPNQFEIIGITNHTPEMAGIPTLTNKTAPFIDNKGIYVRIFIKNKKI